MVLLSLSPPFLRLAPRGLPLSSVTSHCSPCTLLCCARLQSLAYIDTATIGTTLTFTLIETPVPFFVAPPPLPPLSWPLTAHQDNRSVHLVSQEGESFDIKVTVAKMSNLVKTMIDGEMTREGRMSVGRYCCTVPYILPRTYRKSLGISGDFDVFSKPGI